MSEELNLSNLFSNFVRFVKRNGVLLSSFVVLSCLTVILYSTLVRSPHYSSVAICTSNITDFEGKKEFQRPAVDLINYLQFFIEAGDFNALSDLLGIDAVVANKFVQIDAMQLHQLDLNEEYMTLDKFKINITVTSNKFYNEIEEGLIYYFNNNKYLIDISSLYFEGRTRLHNDVVNEINDLRAQRGFKKAGDFVNTEIIASAAVNEIYYLSSIRERTNQEMKYELLSYVQPFSRISMPNNETLIWTILSAVISLVFGFLVALIKEVKTI